jgi:trk system potassium uptake protein TrkA
VMIAGGSLEGRYLAQRLERNSVECTIIDRDRRRCLELAEALPRSLVLHGDATDLELLEMEGVMGVDGFVAATGDDKTNMLTSLLAKNAGSDKVIALVEKFEYLPLVPKVGIDAAVSPRISAVNAILRYIRRGRVLTVATLAGTDAEAIEFKVKADSRVVGKSIAEIHFPKGVLVGGIVRGTEFIAPRGPDTFEPGDDVIMFGLSEPLGTIDRLFA